jgi:hypothetical protein
LVPVSKIGHLAKTESAPENFREQRLPDRRLPAASEPLDQRLPQPSFGNPERMKPWPDIVAAIRRCLYSLANARSLPLARRVSR